MLESKVEAALCAGVLALGGTCDKTVDLGRRGRPDREIVWPQYGQPKTAPVVEFVETKAPKGRLASWQARYHKRLRDQGFTVHVIWNLDQVEDYLRTRGKT